jgi:DNA-binding beta-propeller fold protein YncE
VSVTSTAVSLAECGITVATVLSCAFAESGIGAAICVAGADFTVTDAAPACIEFLAQQIANQFGTSSVTAGTFEAEGLVEDPTDPLNLASVVCTIAQSLFPSGPLIYAVNYYSNSITVMDLQGNIIAMPQGAFPQLNAPDGLAFDPDSGLLYAGNSGNGTVTAYDPTTGILVTTSGGFPPGPCTGYDVIYEKFSHDLYVNEAFCNQMMVYDANGDLVSLPSGAFSGITTPFGMTWNQLNNQILITDGFNNRIFLCDTSGTSCAASGAFPGLSEPDDLVVTPDGNIYVPNESNGTVTEYDPTGSLISTISLPNLTAFPVPETVTFYAADNLTYQILISDTAQNVIWVYDSSGNQTAALGGAGVLNGPKGITVIP